MLKLQNNFLPLLERIWTCALTLHRTSGRDTSNNKITSQICSALVEWGTENASPVLSLPSLGTRFCSCSSLYLFREREHVSSIPHFRRHRMAWGKWALWGVGDPELSCPQIDEEIQWMFTGVDESSRYSVVFWKEDACGMTLITYHVALP